MADSTTIAHLSDLHLGPITGFHPRYWNVKRATGYVNWRRGRHHAYSRAVADRLVVDIKAHNPDHVLVSGDLANIGLPGELAAAKTWLDTVGPPGSTSVVPGNHDIYSHIGNDIGVGRWLDFMAADATDQRARPIDDATFPYVRQIGQIALIGLNSAIETPPFIASGSVGKAQLTRLEAALMAAREARQFRLVMIHHPPLPGQAKRTRALRDADAMADVLSRTGAELVVHGHNHRNMLTMLETIDGICPVVGVPSGSLAHGHAPLARYNLFSIGGRPGAWTVDLVGRGLATDDGPVVKLEQRSLKS